MTGAAAPAVHTEQRGPVLVITLDNPPVNAGSAAVRAGLLDVLRTAATADGVRAAVLTGAGGHFMAGSDLREFDGPIPRPEMPEVIGALDAGALPVIAALHGSALGGGLELALACDARIAAPGTLVGLPEVTLGLLPGAGGTQRLPRLVGRCAALDLACSGRRVGADEARRIGILDEVVGEGDDLVDAAVAYAAGLTGRRRRVDREPPKEPAERIERAVAAARRAVRDHPQIPQIIALVLDESPISDALRKERAAFTALRGSEPARGLRHAFFAERAAARGARRARAGSRPVERVGVVGAGTMGTGIALAAAHAGLPVVLTDAAPDALSRAAGAVEAHFARRIARGRMSRDQAARAHDLITLAPHLSSPWAAPISPDASSRTATAECDVVIEAVVEDLAVKRAVHAELGALTAPGTVLASNTSYLDIDALAAASGRPSDVVGLHFFHPAYAMRLVEVVSGAATAPGAVGTAFRLADQLGKVSVAAGNSEGFIGNRIYAAYRDQVEALLLHGATPGLIDAAMRDFGFAMGPCAVADASGLDIAWHMRGRKRADGTLPPGPTVADRLCEQGRFGVKSGAGWYRYAAGERTPLPDPLVEALLADAAAERGIVRREPAAEEIQRAAMAAIVTAAALVHEAGTAADGRAIDVTWLHGYGFPRWRGGPVFWALRQDRGRLLDDIAEAAARTGTDVPHDAVAALLDDGRRTP